MRQSQRENERLPAESKPADFGSSMPHLASREKNENGDRTTSKRPAFFQRGGRINILLKIFGTPAGSSGHKHGFDVGLFEDLFKISRIEPEEVLRLMAKPIYEVNDIRLTLYLI